MTSDHNQTLQTLAGQYADPRFNIFDVQAEESAGGLTLRGRVLEESQRAALREAFPGRPVDISAVRVLRRGARRVAVAANLTHLQAQPTWLSEVWSQLLAGQMLEVLEEHGRWALVRQDDGYLGYAYLPYLTAAAPLPATHIVTAPHALLRAAPGGRLLGRIFGGTCVTLLASEGEYARVSVFAPEGEPQPAQAPAGWLPLDGLRSLGMLPNTPSARRAQIMLDAPALIGVPYLWGGVSANGIDCSGFAQLLHRWVGISLPRDADLQYEAGQPVEPPYQPGDLLFFSESGDARRITHVAVSTGGWSIIHSSRRINGVYFDDVQAVPLLRDSFVGGRTFVE